MRYAPRYHRKALVICLQLCCGCSVACATTTDHIAIYIADLFATPFDPRDQVDAGEIPCIMVNGCPGRVLDDQAATFATDYNTLVCAGQCVTHDVHAHAPRTAGLWRRSYTAHFVSTTPHVQTSCLCRCSFPTRALTTTRASWTTPTRTCHSWDPNHTLWCLPSPAMSMY